MRDVNDSNAEHTTQPGGWLHLDVSRGASGAMIAGALLHLGVPERVVREAFDAAGLSLVGLRATEVTRAGVHGVHVELTDEEGRPLLETESPRIVRRAGRRVPLRRRQQAPHSDVRTPDERKVMGIAQADESGAPEEEISDLHVTFEEPRAAVLPLGGEVGPGPEPHEEPPARQGAVYGWLQGEPASASALLSFVSTGELAPVPKAIAGKALRRVLEARAAAFGDERLDEPTLPGQVAVALVAEAIACAALLAALSPARVSASALSLDTAPDPWLDAVLVGMRAREQDIGFSPTTPLGAALVWAVAHRSGPRGDLVLRRAGSGVGRALVRARPELSRALYGDDVVIDTRAGGAVLRRLEAVLDRGETTSLLAALSRAGAFGILRGAVEDGDGRPAERLLCSAPEGALDDVTQLLLNAGAPEVLVSTVERRRAERRE